MKNKYYALATVIPIVLVILVMFSGYITPFIPSRPVKNNISSQINLSEGFEIQYYSKDVPGARSMALSDSGTLFVGSRGEGKIYAVLDNNKDNVGEEVLALDENLNSPNGVALKNGSLYVATISKILKYENIEENLESPPEPEIVFEGYPENSQHGWKFIKFGPEGDLYVPVGAPCNICNPEEPFATLTRLDLSEGSYEIYAEGIRNTVGFDWNPETGNLWFTDNGRDWMGDNKPPDELNKITREGMNFGYPYCHGKNFQDPEFDEYGCQNHSFIPPELQLDPHVAALGMEFYEGEMFPEKYRGGIFIAEHGSWNRKVPIGYRVMFVGVLKGHAISREVFASGWLEGNTSWGRPVDVEVMEDGSLLVSDDKSGSIYRISYKAG